MKCPSYAELPEPVSSDAAMVRETVGVQDENEEFPCLTIVTPSYNQAAYLERTIRSVLLQGYPRLEYFVIDGGSTDGSVDILRKYEPWLSGWVSERDRGQSDAINKGWKRGTGEIIAWINSDDFYYPGAFAAAAKALANDSTLAGCYGTCHIVDANGQFQSEFRIWDYSYLELLSEWASRIPQPSTFLRRTKVEEVGWLDEDLQLAMDYDLWVKLGARWPFARVPGTWAAWREHPECKTCTLHGDGLVHDAWKVYERLLTMQLLGDTERRCVRRQLRRLSRAMVAACLQRRGAMAALGMAARELARDPAQVPRYGWELCKAVARRAFGE